MIDGKVIFICQIVLQLQSASDSLLRDPDQNADVFSEMKPVYAQLGALSFMETMQDVIKDEDLIWRVAKLRNQLHHREHFTSAGLSRELMNLRDQLLLAIAKPKFAYIPTEATKFFEQDALFGQAVYDTFPDVREEIKDAGNAFAAGLYSACVFHVMRVAEHGMKFLARRLQIKLRENKKPLAIDYATWNGLITGIKNKLETIRKNPKSPMREIDQERFSNLADQCAYFRDIWRDQTMHARRRYNEDEARRAINRVNEFMELLSRPTGKR